MWFTNKEIDLNDPFQKKWYLEQVLSHGRAEDIAELDWDEIKKVLSELHLPIRVFKLWRAYFESSKR